MGYFGGTEKGDRQAMPGLTHAIAGEEALIYFFLLKFHNLKIFLHYIKTVGEQYYNLLFDIMQKYFEENENIPFPIPGPSPNLHVSCW